MDKKEISLLGMIVLIGTFLRTYNLGSLPVWHWDEGVNMNIAGNLANGKLLWFSLKYAFIPHPPMFFGISAILLKIFGNELIVLRSFSVICSMITLVFIYITTKDLKDKKTAALASFLFATYPTAIYWNRMAFANNLMMLFTIAALFCIVKYTKDNRSHWLYLAALTTSLSLITEILGVPIFIAIFFILWKKNKTRIIPFTLLSAVFPIIFVITMLAISPTEFINDITHNSGRLNYRLITLLITITASITYIPQAKKIFRSSKELMKKIYILPIECLRENQPIFFLTLPVVLLQQPSDALFGQSVDYYFLGLLAMIYITNRDTKNILSTFMTSFIVTSLILNRLDHMMIPLYPILCIGLGFFLPRAYEITVKFAEDKIKQKRLHSVSKNLFRTEKLKTILVLLLFFPIAVNLYYDIATYITEDLISTEDMKTAKTVAEYVNSITTEESIVLTNSHLTKMITARTTVLIQSAAYDRKEAEYMRADYEISRFAFNCSYTNADYIVIRKEAFEKAKTVSGLENITESIETWPNVTMNNYIISENPKKDG